MNGLTFPVAIGGSSFPNPYLISPYQTPFSGQPYPLSFPTPAAIEGSKDLMSALNSTAKPEQPYYVMSPHSSGHLLKAG